MNVFFIPTMVKFCLRIFCVLIFCFSQRRIGTRGSDKGVKEEIKLAIKRQISRSNEPLDELSIKFLTQERGHILQTLII